MKKLLLLFTLLLCTGTIKAQTKEETIAWLTEKLGTCLKGYASYAKDIKVVNVNECDFTVSYVIHDRVLGDDSYTQVIPTSVTCDTTDGDFSFPNSLKLIKEISNNGTITYHSVADLAIDTREENIRQRITNALQHLATFCPAKKAEAF